MRRHISKIFISILLFPLLSHSYYGLRSTEATLSFDMVVEGLYLENVSLKTLNKSGRYRSQAIDLVQFQIDHLMGIFQSESFSKQIGHQGVLGETEQYKITFTEVAHANQDGWKRFHYNFEGTIVFDKRLFKKDSYKKAIRYIPIKLPLAPTKIYEESIGTKKGQPFNRCTDKHYNTEGDFWYFWDPDKKGCPLKKIYNNQVVRKTGRLQRKRSTEVSYPEFDKLYGDNGNKENFDIAIYIGYINDEKDIRKIDKNKRVKFRKKDDAFTAFTHIIQTLASNGFKLTEEKNAFRVYRDGNNDGKHTEKKGENFFRRFEKKVKTELGNIINTRVAILLSDTAIASHDYTFHYYAIPSLEHTDIFVYDGHSGLGGNLDLSSKDFSEVRFNKDKYQVFFFNGCSTYPYFKGSFFKKKKGTKNLEIITSGLPTFSHTSSSNSLAFLKYFLDGKTRTYQQILEVLDKSNYLENEEEFTYLMGVSGDKDNRWKP